jgi:cytochrome b6-f complex iron-sulfur subunit
MASDRNAQQTRRRFLRNGMFTALGLSGIGGFASVLSGFLRSEPKRQTLELEGAKFQRPTGEKRFQPILFGEPDRSGDFYIVDYPAEALPKAREVYSPAITTSLEDGVMALSRRCPHAGQNLAWCDSAQWFECPSHGAQFNAVGERKGGPAPRGMDQFAIKSLGNHRYEIDRSKRFRGAADGTNTTGQESEGPHCV